MFKNVMYIILTIIGIIVLWFSLKDVAMRLGSMRCNIDEDKAEEASEDK